ncbi:MAG: cupin domain-containing protein, partial [Acidimicrobiia bacterium]
MSLYGELFRRRDEQRRQRGDAVLVVPGNTRPVEESAQGHLQWYLHPALDGAALRTLGVYVQEIPPGSRSGRYRWQGGEAIVFLAGRGVSEVDGERFEWEAGDALIVPVRDAGVTLCHHNPHDEPARFICAWPDLTPVLGMDL